jgi:LAS superfamily LD-carboxypeptidase LdcB
MNEEFAFETFDEQPFSMETEEETHFERGRGGARRFGQRPRGRIYRPIVDPRYARRRLRRRLPIRRRVRQLVWPGWVFPPGYPQPTTPFPVDPPAAPPKPRPAGGGGSAGFGSPVPPTEPVDVSPDVDVEPAGVETPDTPEPTDSGDSEFFLGSLFNWLMPFVPKPVETPGGGRIKDKRAPGKSDIVNVGGVQRQIPVHRLAAEAWQAMVDAARADGVAEPLLRPVSGFRDPAHQAVLWEQALKRYGSAEAARKWVAPPGSSPHQSGRAMDLYLGGSNDSANVAKLRTLPAYRWLVGNAQRFGFYPYDAEPWHWEYNPPAAGSGEMEFAQPGFGIDPRTYRPQRPGPRPGAGHGECTCPR